MQSCSIAVIGATGAVGQVFLKLLEERSFPASSIRLYASRRSAGQILSVNCEKLVVEETTPDSFAGVDIAFVSATNEVSSTMGPQAVAAGALVIDDSSVFRMDPVVPLVVPEINANDLAHHGGIISIPNCSTIQMVMALYPLHKANPIKRIIVDTYQSVSGTGGGAIQELREQTGQVLRGEETSPQHYPHQIAFSILPHIDTFREDGYTREERKMIEETRKILHTPDLAISATCVRVPVEISHSEAIHVEFTSPMSPEEARELLDAFPGVQVMDNPKTNTYPMPLDATGTNDVLVGRIREDTSHPNGLAMWVVADNLRKGAALNALQIAEEILHRDLLTSQRA